MKVLGENGDKLICEVSRGELEKFYDCYCQDKNPIRQTIINLKPGGEIDLSSGYDHLMEINRAFSQIKEFVKANESVVKAISSGLILLAKQDGE